MFPLLAIHGTKVISPIKAKAPAPAGETRRHSFTDEQDDEDDSFTAIPGATTGGGFGAVDSTVSVSNPAGTASAARRASSSENGNRPGTADAAGAVASAEIDQLERLVTMGDGEHDVYTCHCWGLDGTLWAVNEPGRLVSTRNIPLIA